MFPNATNITVSPDRQSAVHTGIDDISDGQTWRVGFIDIYVRSCTKAWHRDTRFVYYRFQKESNDLAEIPRMTCAWSPEGNAVYAAVVRPNLPYSTSELIKFDGRNGLNVIARMPMCLGELHNDDNLSTFSVSNDGKFLTLMLTQHTENDADPSLFLHCALTLKAVKVLAFPKDCYIFGRDGGAAYFFKHEGQPLGFGAANLVHKRQIIGNLLGNGTCSFGDGMSFTVAHRVMSRGDGKTIFGYWYCLKRKRGCTITVEFMRKAVAGRCPFDVPDQVALASGPVEFSFDGRYIVVGSLFRPPRQKNVRHINGAHRIFIDFTIDTSVLANLCGDRLRQRDFKLAVRKLHFDGHVACFHSITPHESCGTDQLRMVLHDVVFGNVQMQSYSTEWTAVALQSGELVPEFPVALYRQPVVDASYVTRNSSWEFASSPESHPFTGEMLCKLHGYSFWALAARDAKRTVFSGVKDSFPFFPRNGHVLSRWIRKLEDKVDQIEGSGFECSKQNLDLKKVMPRGRRSWLLFIGRRAPEALDLVFQFCSVNERGFCTIAYPGLCQYAMGNSNIRYGLLEAWISQTGGPRIRTSNGETCRMEDSALELYMTLTIQGDTRLLRETVQCYENGKKGAQGYLFLADRDQSVAEALREVYNRQSKVQRAKIEALTVGWEELSVEVKSLPDRQTLSALKIY